MPRESFCRVKNSKVPKSNTESYEFTIHTATGPSLTQKKAGRVPAKCLLNAEMTRWLSDDERGESTSFLSC